MNEYKTLSELQEFLSEEEIVEAIYYCYRNTIRFSCELSDRDIEVCVKLDLLESDED